jgi:phage protein D
VIVSVDIGGAIFARGDVRLISGQVVRERGKKKSSSAAFGFADPDGELFATLPALERAEPLPVSVRVGPTPATLTTIFNGRASSMGWSWAPGRLSLHSVDRSRASRRRRRTRTLARTSLGDLARELAEADGLTLETIAADPEALTGYGAVLQHAESDWDTLERVAAALGHDVFVDGDVLHIAPVWAAQEPSAQGVVIRSDSPELARLDVSITEPLPSTTARLLDVDGEQSGEDEGEATERLSARRRVGLNLGAEVSPADLKELGRLAMKGRARVTKRVKASVSLEELRPDISEREVIALSGFGARVDGTWRAERVAFDLAGLNTKLALLKVV